MTDSFITGKRWDLQWEEDTDLLTLGSGVMVKVYRQDAANGRLDLLVKFPPGYVEPAHAHDSEHSIVVLEGVQIVEGYLFVPATIASPVERSFTDRSNIRRGARSSPRSLGSRRGTATPAPRVGNRTCLIGRSGRKRRGWNADRSTERTRLPNEGVRGRGREADIRRARPETGSG